MNRISLKPFALFLKESKNRIGFGITECSLDCDQKESIWSEKCSCWQKSCESVFPVDMILEHFGDLVKETNKWRNLAKCTSGIVVQK